MTSEIVPVQPASNHARIGVFSHGGTKNLGDEALFAAVIQNVRLRVPAADIIGFTINPDDTSARHSIPSFPIRRPGKVAPSASKTTASSSLPASQVTAPVTSGSGTQLKNILKSIPGLRFLGVRIRRLVRTAAAVLAEPLFLLDSYRRLKGVELLLVAGSQQLNDIYGAWGFPYTLYKWTLLAKCARTKVAILSVGAGPIDSPLSKFFIRGVLKRVSYRSYRDAISSRLVQSIGAKGNHPVFPDLVYSLQFPTPKPAPTISQRTVVGTNPVPFYDGRYWRTPDPVRYRQYLGKFAKFTEWLDKTGHSILFFPTQTRADVLTIDDIQQSLNGSAHSPNILARQPIESLEDLVSEISRADLVVANRYHGILISLILNKPVLGVAYHEKSRALLAQVGQGDYVLNVADFRTEELIERFSALEADAPAIRKRIASSMAPLRKALAEQYDTVFELIGIRPEAASTN